GGERTVAVPAPGQRAVRGQAAAVHVAAGGRLYRAARLARGIPAAVDAGFAGYAVVRGRPGAAPVESARRAVRRLGAAVRAAVHLPGEEGPDRPAGDLLDHV